MKTSDFKKGKKVKLIPWKKAKALYGYEQYDDMIDAPYGDDTGALSWNKSEYSQLQSLEFIMKSRDIDGDFIMTFGDALQPCLLMNIAIIMNFKSILSNN